VKCVDLLWVEVPCTVFVDKYTA